MKSISTKEQKERIFSEESETAIFDLTYNTQLLPKMVPIRPISAYHTWWMMPHLVLSSSNSLGKSNKDFLALKGHTVVLFSKITSRKNERVKKKKNLCEILCIQGQSRMVPCESFSVFAGLAFVGMNSEKSLPVILSFQVFATHEK